MQCLGKSSQLTRVDIGLQSPQFVDLKESPLGSVLNILFWNDPQRQILTQVDNMEHTLLTGDYGTGWCKIIMSFYQIFIILCRKDSDPGGGGSVSVSKEEH